MLFFVLHTLWLATSVTAGAAPRSCAARLKDLAPHRARPVARGPKQGPVSEAVENFVQWILLPVLDEGERRPYARITTNPDSVHVESRQGTIDFVFTQDPRKRYPREGLPEVSMTREGSHAKVVIYAPTDFLDHDRLMNVTRSALRGTELHPLNPRPEEGPVVFAPEQKRALDTLLGMEDTDSGHQYLDRALVGPGGLGKTNLEARYAGAVAHLLKSRRSTGWTKKPKVLLIVNSEFILDRSIEVFQQELGLKHPARLFGEGSKAAIPADTDIVAVSRENAFRRLAELKNLVNQDPDQPWVLVFDEAHHTGKDSGARQFQKVKTALHQTRKWRQLKNVRELDVSQTYWHRDQPGLLREKHGNVVGMFLTPDEENVLRNVHGLEELAALTILQYYRAMEQGYLSPIYGIQFASAPRTRLAEDLLARIRKGHLPGVVDRGVVGVTTIREANDLSLRLGQIDPNAEYRPLHSDLSAAQRQDTLDWYSNRGKYATDKDRHKAKYLVAVNMFREGVNIPQINLVVILRNFGEDLSGFGNFLQFLTRGSRNFVDDHTAKPSLRVIDYSQYSAWLRDNIARISVEPRAGLVPHAPGENPFLRDRSRFPSGSPSTFRLPDHINFISECPFFDMPVFRKETAPFLRRLVAVLGERAWSHGFGPKKLALELAGRLPAGDLRDQLLSRLASDDWGWIGDDGKTLDSVAPAAQRLFRALHEIASVYNVYHPQAPISLKDLHTAEGMRLLIDGLAPAERPLVGVKDIREFLDPAHGGLAALGDRFREEKSTGPEWPYLRFFEKAARQIGERFPAVAGDADKLARGLGTRWEWTKKDPYYDTGLSAAGLKGLLDSHYEHRRGFNRIYAAWRALAFLWNQGAGAGQPQIDLGQLHTRNETEKFLALLFPPETAQLSGADLAKFMDFENGTLGVVSERAPGFGVPMVSKNGALKRFALQLAHSPRLASLDLVRAIEEVPRWPVKDWVRATRGEGGFANTYYGLLHRMAVELKTKHPGYPIDPDHLIDPTQMRRFLDYLQLGFELPPPATPRDRKTFLGPEGSWSVLQSKLALIGIASPNEDWSASRIIEAIAKAIPDTPETHDTLALLTDATRWGWARTDGRRMTFGESAQQKFLRALQTLATLWNQTHPQEPPLDVARMQEGEQMERFLARALPQLNDLAPADRKQFIDRQNGGLSALRDRAYVFGFNVASQPSDTLVGFLASHLPAGKERAAVLKRLSQDSSLVLPSDMNNAFSDNAIAANRLYRALHQLATALKTQRPESAFSPDAIGTREGMEAFLDELVIGFEIPRPSAETLQKLADERTGALERLRAYAEQNGAADFDVRRGSGLPKAIGQIAAQVQKRIGKSPFLDMMKDPEIWASGHIGRRGLSEDEGLLRVYRALYGMSYLLNERAGAHISLDRVGTARGWETLMSALEG